MEKHERDKHKRKKNKDEEEEEEDQKQEVVLPPSTSTLKKMFFFFRPCGVERVMACLKSNPLINPNLVSFFLFKSSSRNAPGFLAISSLQRDRKEDSRQGVTRRRVTPGKLSDRSQTLLKVYGKASSPQ